jgi:hypothetical protein
VGTGAGAFSRAAIGVEARLPGTGWTGDTGMVLS